MIVDTSVWIDYLDRRVGPGSRALEALVSGAEPLQLLPCIVMEILQGARSPTHMAELERALDRIPVLVVPDAVIAARRAATIYARCRWRGITPRSTIDCLVAASCLELDLSLLHSDRDFDAMVQFEPALRAVRV